MTRREMAIKIAELVNAGTKPSAACEAVGIDPESVYSEDSSAIELDDPYNLVIDLGYDDDDAECLVLRRDSAFGGARWDVIAHTHLTDFEKQRLTKEQGE